MYFAHAVNFFVLFITRCMSYICSPLNDLYQPQNLMMVINLYYPWTFLKTAVCSLYTF